MQKFTLIVKDLTTGAVSFQHVAATELAEAHVEWEEAYPNTELQGAMHGHVEPIWWIQ